MQAQKPKFTDSELFLMEDIVREDLTRWIDKHSGSPDFEEVKQEYDSILNKLKSYRQEQHNWSKAIDALTKPMHYYVYYTKLDEGGKENTFYERTCGTVESANNRVKELLNIESINSAYWSNNTVKGAFC